MNQQQITDEVKRLAKKIVEYWRVEIYEGCWVLRKSLADGNVGFQGNSEGVWANINIMNKIYGFGEVMRDAFIGYLK